MPQNMIAIKSFHLLFAIGLFLLDVVAFNINWSLAAIAVAGAFSGSFVLGYFQPSPRFWDRLNKTIASSIASLFVGFFVVEFYNIEKFGTIGFLFFVLGFLILLILKPLLDFTEMNAPQIIAVIFKRSLNYLPNGQRVMRKKRRRAITRPVEREETEKEKIL